MRKLDYIIIFALGLMLFIVVTIRRDLNNSMWRYQMNSNYVSNLNECRSKTTQHDWMFQMSGITDYLKKKYPDAKY